MELTESQILDVIYEHPWLLSENYCIADIEGTEGIPGRNIQVTFRGKEKKIDLLFKDAMRGNPVIVVLLREFLTYESVRSILDFRFFIQDAGECEISRWQKIFGHYYFAPKLVLIGVGMNSDTIIFSNLLGVQTRIINMDHPYLNLEVFQNIDSRLKSWSFYKPSPKMPIHNRVDFIDYNLILIKELLKKLPVKVTTIDKIPYQKKNCYVIDNNPFINIPFYNEKGQTIAGLFEVFNSNFPYNDEFLYFQFKANNTCTRTAAYEIKFNELIDFAVANQQRYVIDKYTNNLTILFPKKTFTRKKAMKELLGKLLIKAVEIRE